MASLLLPTAADKEATPTAVTPVHAPAEAPLVASFGDPVAADVPHGCVIDLSQRDAVAKIRDARVSQILLFLPRRLDTDNQAALDSLIALAKAPEIKFVGIVSTFRVHLGDESASELEHYVVGRLQECSAHVAIIRPSHVLSAHSTARVNLQRFGFLAPLAPKRMHGCCVTGAELFAAIEHARQGSRRRRIFTLLGPRRSWQDWLGEQRGPGAIQAGLTLICWILSLTLIGHVAALVVDLIARWRPAWRVCNVGVLRPRSFSELLAIYNPCNFQHVKIVGYNNGVVHFGQRFPDKTVVSTVRCNRVTALPSLLAEEGSGVRGTAAIKADCGTTIRKAMDFLAAADRELYVIPNYSYVCLGTAFFVPIHGSASEYTTVADTITQALLYDPVRDRFLHADRDGPAFRDNVYRIDSPILLLRLRLRVKPKARYFVERRAVENASADDLLNALRDTQAANVEIRKSKAAGSTVEISKYYLANDKRADLLEVPRDSLGRLWDRLEENALTSFLMHALTRWLAWHVELFFSADEFRTFWQTHRSLPLKKIQLRHIRRDGLPCSPFREHDCLSADMFMFRWRRQAFEAYLKRTFAVVRSNPGKHSQ